MDAKQLLQAMVTSGWGGLENTEDMVSQFNEQQQAADKEQMLAEARIVRDMVATPEGNAFLSWLLEKTLLRPPGAFEQNAATAEMYAIAKARREGQNLIAFTVLSALKAVDEGKPMESEE